MPCEQLVQTLCNQKQRFTQIAGKLESEDLESVFFMPDGIYTLASSYINQIQVGTTRVIKRIICRLQFTSAKDSVSACPIEPNQANHLPTAVHFSEGFGQRVPVPENVGIHLNAQYQGKPAFFDSSKGLFYDGQRQLYLYQSDNTATAIESSALQQNPLGVGNFSLYL